jgi:hypothetical protein
MASQSDTASASTSRSQKHVSQIQIFKSDSHAINAYCMLLTIADGPLPASGAMAVAREAKHASISLKSRIDDWGELKNEDVGRHVVKEHVIYG